jgi:hypothetical protein
MRSAGSVRRDTGFKWRGCPMMDAHNAAVGSTTGAGTGFGEPVAATAAATGGTEVGRTGLGWLGLALTRGNIGGRAWAGTGVVATEVAVKAGVGIGVETAAATDLGADADAPVGLDEMGLAFGTAVP